MVRRLGVEPSRPRRTTALQAVRGPSPSNDACLVPAAAKIPPVLHPGERGQRKCIRELFGTLGSRNSIWSARILRLLRMNASYLLGT